MRFIFLLTASLLLASFSSIRAQNPDQPRDFWIDLGQPNSWMPLQHTVLSYNADSLLDSANILPPNTNYGLRILAFDTHRNLARIYRVDASGQSHVEHSYRYDRDTNGLLSRYRDAVHYNTGDSSVYDSQLFRDSLGRPDSLFNLEGPPGFLANNGFTYAYRRDSLGNLTGYTFRTLDYSTQQMVLTEQLDSLQDAFGEVAASFPGEPSSLRAIQAYDGSFVSQVNPIYIHGSGLRVPPGGQNLTPVRFRGLAWSADSGYMVTTYATSTLPSPYDSICLIKRPDGKPLRWKQYLNVGNGRYAFWVDKTFTYDSLGRLVEVIVGGERSTTYTRYRFGSFPALISKVRQDQQVLPLTPNPVADRVRVAGIKTGSKVELTDAFGRYHVMCIVTENGIDLTTLVPGLYTLRAGNRQARFIKN